MQGVASSSGSPPLLVIVSGGRRSIYQHPTHAQKNITIENTWSCVYRSACQFNASTKLYKQTKGCGGALARNSLSQRLRVLRSTPSRYFSLLVSHGNQNFTGFGIHIQRMIFWREKVKSVSITLIRLVVGMLLVMAVSVTVHKSPSWSLTEENLLFLEAWRTVDRAYYDKTFNGQSWFRYREAALRNEPMNTREETYMAIRKMLSTLDDPFTRFLEPEKFRSLRSGTQGALTGIGLSIGYPTGSDESTTGFVVISSSPEGPADQDKAGVIPGDIILTIDDISTEDMDVYDAAERLQGAEGSTVSLDVRSGADMRHILLRREKVKLNPVKARLCEISGSGTDISRIGYIKLTSFNQNASAFPR